MSTWVSARLVHLKEGEHAELEYNERVLSATQDHPHFWLIVVKETSKIPELGKDL